MTQAATLPHSRPTFKPPTFKPPTSKPPTFKLM